MKLFESVINYNEIENMELYDLLLELARNVDASIDSSVLYWFAKDVINKNDEVRPISVVEENGEIKFINNDNSLLFSMKKFECDTNSFKSPLRTNFLPLFDSLGYYFYNDQFITGEFGLYEDYSKNNDLSSYRYITFDKSNRLLNEFLVDFANSKMEKIHYDKHGIVKTKYFYNIKLKETICDNPSDVINRVSKYIDDNYLDYSKNQKERMFYECVDGYFYDISLYDEKYKYKDFYVSKRSKIYSKKMYDYFMENAHINGVHNRNIEKSFCKANSYNPNVKLLCLSDFVNGFMLKRKVSNYPINEMNSFIDSIDYYDTFDDSVLLNKYESKISEINKFLNSYLEHFSKKHRRKTRNRTIGSAFGSILIGNEKTFIFNCGDTRVYSLNKGSFKPLTCDDTIVWDMFKDEQISRDEASQYQRNAKLTKYLGQSKELSNKIITINNNEYDKLLLLSDGVTDYVNEATIETIISVNNDEDILDTLVVHANKNRSKYEDVTGCCYSKKSR